MKEWIDTIGEIGERRRKENNKLTPSKGQIRYLVDYAKIFLEKANYIEFIFMLAHEEVISFEKAQEMIDWQREQIKMSLESFQYYLYPENLRKGTKKRRKDMLLELKDGGILDIRSDRYDISECPEKRYVNEFYIKLTTIEVNIDASRMYNYPLSEEYMMRTILPNVELIKQMTENEFTNWLKEHLESNIDIESLEFEAHYK